MTGIWNATTYDEAHGYVWRLGAGLVGLLAAGPGERVLDLGCGTGHLAAEIARSGAEVVGIDSSPEMVEQARCNYPELRFEVADSTDFSFPEPFDAVFSNAALHWMRPPERVAGCVARTLKPGGRLVAELGGRGNIAAVVSALEEALEREGVASPHERNPWYFPNIAEYATLLERHGLEVRQAALWERPTRLDGGEGGLRNWLGTFAGAYLDRLGEDARAAVVLGVEYQLRAELWQEGAWHADYVRLRVMAIRSADEPGGADCPSDDG